ncbi:PREDICTED: uncharacterized protein LOC105454662 [Wasmannia auropunctata]|uniref:uncharacterized protein LOC105454662 n=1 Tax=Wasmannia auropunctata TaxID=64793 RepID=UPI0005EE4145|nr:PREDICTED: uncharacterized protein LOC105454662 [Wasmannia auropunctata]XP_011695754.1 PREDICTED: uncharacterized protein LOC105454662 [Wasmannia auropunctata]
MEGKEISDKRQVENIFADNEMSSEKKQASSFLSSYTKSYSSTQIESITFEHSWKIDKFRLVFQATNILRSPRFPENGENMIQANAILESECYAKSKFVKAIQLYIRTNTAFIGSCTTTVKNVNYNSDLSKSISGHMKDMTLLIEISNLNYNEFITALEIHCKFEICQRVISKSMHMNLLPFSTIYSKDVKSEDSTLNQFEPENKNPIKFIISGEQFVIPKTMLYATNSNYFKNICLTYKEDEIELTNELMRNNEVQAFKYLLLFILTGSIKEIQVNYDMLKKLLTIANKYDVSALKVMCEHYLLHCITIRNAVELIRFAFSSNAKFLETHSAAFIKFHLTEITNTKEFRNLSQKDSSKIMELSEKSEIHKTKAPNVFSIQVCEKSHTSTKRPKTHI